MAEQLSLDVGAGEVHVASAAPAKKATSNALTVTAGQRKKMPASQFADPANKAYPIHDKAHADNAAARLEQQKGSISSGKYQKIKSRIKAAQRRFGEKSKTASSTAVPPQKNKGMFHLRMSNGKGGFTSIRHQMSAAAPGAYAAVYDDEKKELFLYVPLDKTHALSAGDADGRVWIQIAKTGAWAGHPQGAFQITGQTLDLLAANFRGQQVGRLQYDFNHASACPPNSGNIPVVGTPAQGWFYDVQRQGDKLFALTEWKALAKQYIENDQYGGVSPLINWNGLDRVSGKPIGPELRSIALTNLPFLLGMQRPTAASADDSTQLRGLMALEAIEPSPEQALEAYSYYSTANLLPQLKKVLGLHELSTAKQCSAALCNLSSHLDAVDGDASAAHEGINLGSYMSSLRGLFGGSDEMSSSELIQYIDGLLDEYMKDNDIEDDDSGASLTAASASPVVTEEPVVTETPEQPAATAASVEGATMPDPVVAPAAITAPAETVIETTPAIVETPAVAAETPVVVAAVETAASAAVEPTPEVALLTLQLAAAQAKTKQLEEQVQSLSANAVATDTAQAELRLSAEVDSAIRVYGITLGLTTQLKPHLLSLLRSNPESFRAMYVPVAADQEHLLLSLTGGGASNPQAPGARVEADTSPPVDVADPEPTENERVLALGLTGLTDKIIKESNGKVQYLAAQNQANEILNKARQASTH